jgi:two-component sensor histidine kinase
MFKKKFPYFLFCLLFIQVINAQDQLAVYKSKLKEYRYSSNLDSTKFYFRKSIPIALQRKDSVSVFRIYKYMGDAYEHHQKLDSTLLMYDLGEHYIPKSNLKLKAFLLNDRAYTYNLLHDYENATKLMLQALKIAEQANDKDEIANVLTHLADGYSKLNLNKQAEKFYNKAILFSKERNNQKVLHQAYRYYAIHQIKNKEFDKAFINLTEANKIVFKSTDSISMAYNWYYLADCYWNKKDFKNCFQVAKKAEKMWEIRAEYIDLSAVCLKLGNYYLSLGSLKQAEYYLKKSEKYILKDLYFNEKLYSALANLYQKKANYSMAFDYLLKAKNTITKIKDNESKSKIASLNIQFETERNEKEIQEQAQKNELAELKLSKTNIQLKNTFIILFFLVLTVFIISFFYRKIERKNKLLFQTNFKLEQTLNQKQILLKELHHRVKNNLTTLKSLLYLQANSSNNEEVKSVLNECQLRIQSMAFIHQNLYNEIENDNVDFSLFLKQLLQSLKSSYSDVGKPIDVDLEKSNINIDFSVAIFLGLILNELVTNSFKYAFDNQSSGNITVKLIRNVDSLQVIYSDDGSGLSNGFTETSGGFGFKIIRILTQQIDAEIHYEYINNLSIFTITLPYVK